MKRASGVCAREQIGRQKEAGQVEVGTAEEGNHQFTVIHGVAVVRPDRRLKRSASLGKRGPRGGGGGE